LILNDKRLIDDLDFKSLENKIAFRNEKKNSTPNVASEYPLNYNSSLSGSFSILIMNQQKNIKLSVN